MTTLPEPPEMQVAAPAPSFWRNLSLVWLVPIIALVISLGVAWKAYSDRGGVIEISFANAGGILPGETTIRYRDVVVGTVERVSFTDDLGRVIVRARVDQKVLPFLDAEAQFWVVTPQVTTRGISGLSTVLSGVYIEGSWDNTPGAAQTSFTGLGNPPLVQQGREGRRITLRTTPGVGVSEGGPVLYRGIEIGHLERPRLAQDGRTVLVDAFIDAPHDRRINAASRFWDTSGFSVSFGAAGFALNIDSIASLIAGGVAFDNIYENGRPVEPDHVFDIFYDESQARASAFAPSLGDLVTVSVAFSESISGLSNGASVLLGGLRVGEVTAIAARIVETATGPEVQLVANLGLDPRRLGLGDDAGEAEVLAFFARTVPEGLRARLATSGLFSASLIVELVRIPDAPPAALDLAAQPFPTMPAVLSDLPEFTATVEGVLDRINRLPIEDILNQAIRTMAALETLLADDDLRALPGTAGGLLDDARSLLQDEATRAIPGDLQAVTADLRAVLAELRNGGTIAALTSAIARLDAAMENVASASEELPALVDELRALAAKANALETEEIVAATARVLNSVDALIGTDAARALPPALTGALDEVRGALAELRAGGVIDNVNATLSSAQGAAGAIEAASRDLPAMIARLDGVLRRADGLVAAYGDRSNFNSETLAMLREIRAAAKMVGQLARTIERNPSALITGR